MAGWNAIGYLIVDSLKWQNALWSLGVIDNVHFVLF